MFADPVAINLAGTDRDRVAALRDGVGWVRRADRLDAGRLQPAQGLPVAHGQRAPACHRCRPTRFARRAVLVGTTNYPLCPPNAPSGNRRFVPIGVVTGDALRVHHHEDFAPESEEIFGLRVITQYGLSSAVRAT